MSLEYHSFVLHDTQAMGLIVHRVALSFVVQGSSRFWVRSRDPHVRSLGKLAVGAPLS